VAHLSGTAPASAATSYRSLQLIFKWLDEGEIEGSPMIRMGRPSSERPVPVLISDHIQLLLVDCSGKDFRSRQDGAIIRLFLDTGMRLEGMSGGTARQRTTASYADRSDCCA
jgi:site-specific recombinase XerC